MGFVLLAYMHISGVFKLLFFKEMCMFYIYIVLG